MRVQSNGLNRGVIALFGLVQILFIGLKALRVIDNWSWLWVLSPAWIGLSLLLVLILVVAILKR